jgi:hypothetical protein
MNEEPERGARPRNAALIRAVFGYALFGVAVIYALAHAPDEFWHLDLLGVSIAVGSMPAMMALQSVQVVLFLRGRGVRHGWYWPLLFTAKKGVLNAVLPARTGTLALMYMLTRHYPVKWHQYLRFSLVAAAASLVVSGIAAAWLLLSPLQFVLVPPFILATAWGVARGYPDTYFAQMFPLLLVGAGLFLTMLTGFWGVLLGLGHQIGFRQACYFATVLNTLAQVSVTPGNIGVRELLLGALAPYLALSMSVGIIAGGVFHVVRTSVYAGIMFILEIVPHLSPQTFGSIRDEPGSRADTSADHTAP